MIKAILWDLDGTLVDSEPCHEKAFELALAQLGIPLPPTIHDDLLGASETQVHRMVVELGADLTLAEWADLKWQFYQAGAGSIARREDICNAFDHHLHLPMAVVSNSPRRIVDLNLRTSQLHKRIQVSISRNDVSSGKPSPEGYLLAASKLGWTPDQCLVVEDSPVGVEAGLRAGCVTVYAPQQATSSENIPAGACYLQPGDGLKPAFTEIVGASD